MGAVKIIVHEQWGHWAVDKVIGMFNNASMASPDGYPWSGIAFG